MNRLGFPRASFGIGLVLLGLQLTCAPAPRSGFDPDDDSPQAALARVFLDQGFTTGRIFIPGLDVEVPLAANQFYKRETKVADVFARVNQIKARFGEEPLPYSQEAEHQYGWCGMIELEAGGRHAQGFIVLVERNLNPSTRRYTIAHEQGHFLWFLGQQDRVYRQFENPEEIARRIGDSEEFSDLCGWIALRRGGYDLEDYSVRDFDPEGKGTAVRTRDLVMQFLRRTR